MNTGTHTQGLDAQRARHLLESHRDARHQQLLDLTRLPVDEREPADEAVIETTLQVLAEIDLALGRLGAGRYGVCTECGRPLPTERLEVLPYAATCVDCPTPGSGR